MSVYIPKMRGGVGKRGEGNREEGGKAGEGRGRGMGEEKSQPHGVILDIQRVKKYFEKCKKLFSLLLILCWFHDKIILD